MFLFKLLIYNFYYYLNKLKKNFLILFYQLKLNFLFTFLMALFYLFI